MERWIQHHIFLDIFTSPQDVLCYSAPVLQFAEANAPLQKASTGRVLQEITWGSIWDKVFCQERGWAQQLVVSLWWKGLPAGWSAASSPTLVGDPEYWQCCRWSSLVYVSTSFCVQAGGRLCRSWVVLPCVPWVLLCRTSWFYMVLENFSEAWILLWLNKITFLDTFLWKQALGASSVRKSFTT